MNTFILFLVMSLPGHDPVTHSNSENSRQECFAHAIESLAQAEAMHVEGKFQASCIVVVPRSVDN